jgi:hypothetical protein
MRTSETAIGNHDSIDEELFALRQDINEYRSSLNTEAIWLFLATLGCWSVTNTFLQVVAFVLAFVLFVERVTKRRSETRSFSELFQTVKNRISTEGDSEKVRLNNHLAALGLKELSTINNLKNIWTYFLCGLFYLVSCLYVWINFLL